MMIKPQVSPGGACAQVTSVLRGPLTAAEAGRPNLRPGKQAQLLDHSSALERGSFISYAISMQQMAGHRTHHCVSPSWPKVSGWVQDSGAGVSAEERN